LTTKSNTHCPHKDRPHEAKGLCRSCYVEDYFKRNPGKVKGPEYHRKWREENPEMTRAATIRYNERHPEERRAHSLKYRNSIKGMQNAMFHAAKRRAKARNIPFDISREDINIPEICPFLGTPLEHNNSSRSAPAPTSPSLDRIVPSLGYTKGNVRVLSLRANLIKQDATLEELELLVKNWRALKAIGGV
jgi:hypothetical protein